ncbi:MAG: C1 family peptidase [Paraprevotella sp.]|nr:C1 family peptidase [Paraprevotella sp.]
MQLPRIPFRVRSRAEVQLPPSVDNSVRKYFPPILDQMGGSCAQASGIGYMFTYEINRLLDRDASVSADNRFSYQFSWNLLNDGEDQGDFVDQGLYLAQRYGIMTEQDYGISDTYQFKWATGYDKYYKAIQYRASQIVTFADSVEQMKRWLYDAGDGSPVGGILTYSSMSRGWDIDDQYQGPSLTGYHSLLKKLATEGAHALTIAGYDDTVTYTDEQGVAHTGAFIVVNSWGTYSHDRGRFYLPYDFFRDADRPEQQLSHSVEAVRVRIHHPLVVFRVSVNFSSRDDLSFGLATESDVNAQGSITYHTCRAFYNQGGDYPMQGQDLPGNIEIALDPTEYMTDENVDYKTFYLNIVRGFRGRIKGSGQITALSLVDYRGAQPVEYPYRGHLPMTLDNGNNPFSVSLETAAPVSSSAFRYADGSGNVVDQTFRLRTAEGKDAKLRFANPYAENQTITLRYQTEE